jgi:hypothetical protein
MRHVSLTAFEMSEQRYKVGGNHILWMYFGYFPALYLRPQCSDILMIKKLTHCCRQWANWKIQVLTNQQECVKGISAFGKEQW